MKMNQKKYRSDLETFIKADNNAQKVLRPTNAVDIWLELHKLILMSIKKIKHVIRCMEFYNYKKKEEDVIVTHMSEFQKTYVTS